jgi:hypothetical protein
MNATNLIALSDVVDLLPKRRGKKIHIKTVMRWVIEGCRGTRLTATKIGGVWYTSNAWLIEFQQSCSERIRSANGSGSYTGSSQLVRGLLEQKYGITYGTDEEGTLPNLSSRS